MGTNPELLPRSWPSPYPLHRPVLASEALALDAAARAAFSLPASLLMERAALGVAACVALWAPDAAAPGLVLCGPGDNGGDGYAAARQLAGWGRPIRVLDLTDDGPRSPAARTQHALCGRSVPVERVHADAAGLARALASSAYVIDALFGVGLARPLAGWWREAVEVVVAAARPVLAIDVPSGLDADRGIPLPVAIVAEATATMAAPKRGIVAPAPGARHAGRVVEIDIGLPWALHAPLRAPEANAPHAR